MSGDVSPYTDLITSEYQSAPNFMAAVAASVQPFADLIATLQGMPAAFDLDEAAGAQLDVVGQWVGRSRELPEPLTGVYFAWGTEGVGWGQGTWKRPFDPDTGLVSLPDDSYRTLLKATIAANQWDGTIPSGYAVWATLFGGGGNPILDQDGEQILDDRGNPVLDEVGAPILLQDNGDMTMIMALIAPDVDAVTLALFSSGYLNLKPAGVHLTNVVPSVPGEPLFGFGVENNSIAGWGQGCWPTTVSQS